MSFSLFYLGGEQAVWRRVLSDNGVTNLGISFWSWSNRRKDMHTGIDLDDGSFDFDGVLLESGGYQANNKPETFTKGEWESYAESYFRFVETHIDDLTLVSEFDCLALGTAWIKEQRRTFWSQIDPQKFLPVWHPEMGLPALEELGDNYPRLAISEGVISGGGLNVTPHLNALARKGVLLHGSAITKPTVLRQVAFSTAASTSWLSPTQYGDTIVWDNNDLKRYPKKMKEQARTRHRTLFEREGFDAAKILADDKTEITKLTLWSWKQQEQAIQALRSNNVVDRSNNAPVHPAGVNTSTGEINVVTAGSEGGNAEMAREPLQQRPEGDIKPLPMFGSSPVEEMNLETKQVETVQLIEVRGTSARRCDSCAIATRCPEFKPNTTCAYSVPMEIKTKKQRAAFLTAMIEMQAQRVAFGYMVEQANGGYPDANLSQEYDRMLKAMTTQADLEDGRDFLKISVEARGKTGVLGRLFGQENAVRTQPPMQELTAEQTDAVASRIIEGEKVT